MTTLGRFIMTIAEHGSVWTGRAWSALWEVGCRLADRGERRA